MADGYYSVTANRINHPIAGLEMTYPDPDSGDGPLRADNAEDAAKYAISHWQHYGFEIDPASVRVRLVASVTPMPTKQ